MERGKNENQGYLVDSKWLRVVLCSDFSIYSFICVKEGLLFFKITLYLDATKVRVHVNAMYEKPPLTSQLQHIKRMRAFGILAANMYICYYSLPRCLLQEGFLLAVALNTVDGMGIPLLRTHQQLPL